MERKIVFFDIDGTLLDDKTGTVPQSAVDAIHKAQQNGHVLIVNTGRPNIGVDPVIKEIGFDGYICGCGTYIEYKEKELFHVSLEEQIRREIIRKIYECRVQSMLEGVRGVFFTKNATHPHCIEFHENYTRNKAPIGCFEPGEMCEFDKFVVLYDESSDIATMRNFLKTDFEIIERGKGFIEVIPSGYSKATGIQFLIDYLNMDLEQCISIGDSTNDLSMLEYTKESVAMGNSNPILFDKVTHITTDIDKDGIANALEHYGLI